MRAIEFFDLMSELKSAQIALRDHVQDDDVRRVPATLNYYKTKFKEAGDLVVTLEQQYIIYCEAVPPAEEAAANFLMLDLDFNHPRLGAEMGPRIEDLVRQSKALIRALKDDDAIKNTMQSAYHVFHMIFDFLEKEHDFVRKCNELDIDHLRMIFQRYLPGGQIPLINEVDFDKFDNIHQALASLDYFNALQNYFMMDANTAWGLALDLGPGIQFLHGVITSDDFVNNHFQDLLTEMTLNGGELNRIRKEILENAQAAWDKWYGLFFSDSSLLTEVERQQLDAYLKEEALDPYHNAIYGQFINDICARMGINDFRAIAPGFYELYYLQRDMPILAEAENTFLEPRKRIARYETTLKEIVKQKVLGPVDRAQMDALLQTLSAQIARINEQDFTLDNIHAVESRRLTEPKQKAALRKLAQETLDDAHDLANLQDKKRRWKNLFSMDSAVPKKIFLENVEQKLQAWLDIHPEAEGQAREPAEVADVAIPGMDDEDPIVVVDDSFAQQRQAFIDILNESLNAVPEANRNKVFLGRTNRTGDLYDTALEKLNEITRIRCKASSIVRGPSSPAVVRNKQPVVIPRMGRLGPPG